jgi:enoyl-CoA hydratase
VKSTNYSDFAPELLVSMDGPVALVTLNRPDNLNAVNENLHGALSRVWRALDEDAAVRAVVLTGAGRVFCAGGDLSDLDRMSDSNERARAVGEAQRIVRDMLALRPPLIAAVNGAAVGLGCSLVLGADIVYIEEQAHLSDPHVSVGLVAGDGGAALWPAFGSTMRSKEFLFTGDRISSSTAVEIGFATRVVSQGTSVSTAMEMAQRLAVQPAQALQDTKRAVNMHLERAVAGVLETAALSERESMHSAEHLTAMENIQAAASRPER